ncbi:MAG: fructosamine kinase family protein [Longimicrobiales bacterium]
MVAVPQPVRAEAAAALGVSPGSLRVQRPTSGGCISQGVQLATGPDRYFLKWHDRAPPLFFEREAQGLTALSNGPLFVPTVEAHGRDWLLLEWVESAPPTNRSWEALGQGLAQLHRSHRSPGFGWDHANFIGQLPQPNDAQDSWGAFWRDVRLRPFMEEAHNRTLLTVAEREELVRVLEVIPSLIDAVGLDDGPSLLHGDLWSGNVMFAPPAAGDDSAAPVIIDPAVYSGHREVDLAMTRLFGGFPQSFYTAYQQEWPLLSGHEARVSVYQLYPLFVHLLLFGRSYAAQLMATAGQVLGR